MVVLVKTVMSALNAMCKKPEASIQQAETKTLDILKKYDTNKDGEISLKEFQSFVSKDPEILRYLTAYNLIAHDDLRPDFGGGEGEMIPEVDSDLEAEVRIRENINITPMAERIKSGIEHNLKGKNDDEDLLAPKDSQQPWIAQVRNAAPSEYKPKKGESNPPEACLQLDYVYGYRCHDCRNNLKYGPTGEIIYHTAAIGLTLDPKKNQQQFFMEHNDDIISIDVYETMAITGQVGMNPLLCIWDLKSMQSKLILKGILQKGIKNVCFSNDGRKFAAAGLDDDHCIVVYDLEKAMAAKANPMLLKGKSSENSGLLVSGKTTHSEIFDLKFEPADKGLIAGCLKEVLFLTFDNGVLKVVKGQWENYPLQAVLSISFIETNAVTGMFKGELFVWKGNRPYSSVKAHNGPVNALCARKSGKGVISGGNDGFIIVWEANLKKLSQINLVDPALRVLNPKIRSVAEFNGNILVGTRSGEIIEYLGGSKPSFIMRGHFNGELWGLTMHPTMQQAYTVGEDNLLVNWDLVTRKPKAFNKLDFPSRTIHISQDSKYLAVGCLNGSVLIVDPKSLAIITTLKDRQSEVSLVKFSPVIGGYLACGFGAPDFEIFIYNVKANFKIQSKLKGSSTRVQHLDFSEDATKVQFTNTLNEIFHYDVKSGKREPNGVSLHRDEKWASWTLPVGFPVQGIWPPYSQGADINSVDRSATMDTIVTADDFGKVKLFKYPSSKERAGFAQFLGHSAQVTNVRFSFKNEYVISLGGDDKTVLQWRYILDKQAQDEGNMGGFGEEEDEVTEKEHDLFQEEIAEAGDQFMAVKPFKGEVEHSVPSWYKPNKRDNELPNGNLALKWVHGFRCFDMTNGARYGKKNEVVFVQAALGVVLDVKGAGKQLEQSFFQMHEEDIISLAFHPKLNVVATGQMAKAGKAKTIDVYVWDVETKTMLSHLNDFHLRAVNQLAFSPDGSKLLSVGQDDDNSLAIYDWQGKILLTTSKVDKAKVTAVSWKNDQTFVTVGPKHIKFWSISGRNVNGKRGVFGGQTKQEPLVSATFAYQNNQYCVTGSKSGNLYVWTGESAGKPIKAHNGEVAALLANKSVIYSGGDDGVVILWNFGGGGALSKSAQVVEVATISKYRPGIRSLDIKADGTLLVGTRGAEIYEGKQGLNWTILLQGHYDGEVWGCAISPSSHKFATCGGDKTVRLWDIPTRKMLVGTEPFESDCRAIDWAANGKFLVVADIKAKVHLLDAQSLQVLNSLQSGFKQVEQGKGRPAIDPWVEDIKIAPNCQLVALGAHAGASNIEILGIVNNKLQTKGVIKAGLTSALTHLDWSADSDFLVVNSQAYELKFSSVSTMKPVSASSSKDIDWATWTCTLGFYSQGIFPACADGSDVNSVCRSSNRKVLATGDDFGKVNLFKYPSVVEKSLNKQYPGHSSHVTKVKFAFDDCYLVSTGGNDKAVIVWETDFGSGDQNKPGGIMEEKNEAPEVEEEIDRTHFLKPKKKAIGAAKFKQYKEGFKEEAHEEKKLEKKAEDDMFGEEEDKGDESMTIKPWMEASKAPQGFLKPPLNQEKAPLISLELTHVHGYRSKDSRNNVKYLKSGSSIVYPAAGLGVVYDLAVNKQRFFTMHTDDITALTLSPDGLTVATGDITSKAVIFVWDSNTMHKLCEFRGTLSKGVAALAFNPNGDKLAAAGLDDAHSVAVFDVKVQNGALISVSKSGNEPIFDLSFRADCEFADVGVGHIRFWSFSNKTLNCKTGQIPNTVGRVLVSVRHNNDDCVVGDSLGHLQVWKEGIMIGFYKLHDGPLDGLSVQGGYIMTGGQDSVIKILDKGYAPLVAYNADQNIKFSLYPAIRSLCFSGDFKNILIGTLGSEIYEIQTK